MSKPRLLFLSNLFPDLSEPYRGLDNVTILHQLRKDWEIDVLALRPRLDSWIGSTCQILPRDVDRVFNPQFITARYVPKMGGLMNHALMAKDVLNGLCDRSKKYDLLLSSWLYPDGWAAARLAETWNLPLVQIAQGSDVHRYLNSPLRQKHTLDGIAYAQHVITRSHSLAIRLHQHGIPETKASAILNGVHLDQFYYLKDRRYLRNQLGLAVDAEVLLFVGNLLPVKNPQLLLQAFHQLLQQRKSNNLQLIIAGQGPLRADLEKLVLNLQMTDYVRFVGAQNSDQIANWMRAADLLCMSSQNEGLPNVVLEAMASGLPVVATDVGGIHEIIDADWKGILVPNGHANLLAAAMLKMLHCPVDRQQLALYGKSLSWDRTAAAYHQLLCQFVSPKRDLI